MVFGIGKKDAAPVAAEMKPVLDTKVLTREEQIEVAKQKIFGGAVGQHNTPYSTGTKVALGFAIVTVLPAIVWGIANLVMGYKAASKDEAAGLGGLNQDGVKELLGTVKQAVDTINGRTSLQTETPAGYLGAKIARDKTEFDSDLELHAKAPVLMGKVASLVSARVQTLGLDVSQDIVDAAVLKKMNEVQVASKDGFAARLNTEFSKFSDMLYNKTIERFASRKLDELTPDSLNALLTSIEKSRGFNEGQMAGVFHHVRTELQKAHTPEEFAALIAKYDNETALKGSPEFIKFRDALQAKNDKIATEAKAKLEKLAGKNFDGVVDVAYKAYQKAENELTDARNKVFTHVGSFSSLHGKSDKDVADATLSASALADHANFKAKLEARNKALTEFQNASKQLNELNGGEHFFAVLNATKEHVEAETVWHFTHKKDLLRALSERIAPTDTFAMGERYRAWNLLKATATDRK